MFTSDHDAHDDDRDPRGPCPRLVPSPRSARPLRSVPPPSGGGDPTDPCRRNPTRRGDLINIMNE